jgi:hypothetical protein
MTILAGKIQQSHTRKSKPLFDSCREGGETYVRLGRNFSNHRSYRSDIWIWRNRRGIGRNREVVILSVPGDVRDLFLPRLERKKSSMIPDAISSERFELYWLMRQPGGWPARRLGGRGGFECVTRGS